MSLIKTPCQILLPNGDILLETEDFSGDALLKCNWAPEGSVVVRKADKQPLAFNGTPGKAKRTLARHQIPKSYFERCSVKAGPKGHRSSLGFKRFAA